MVGRVDIEFSDSPSSLHLRHKMFSQDQCKAVMERQKSYYRRQWLWLVKRWGQLFQFTAFPDGLACCPGLFTQLLKPVMAALCMWGFISSFHRWHPPDRPLWVWRHSKHQSIAWSWIAGKVGFWVGVVIALRNCDFFLFKSVAQKNNLFVCPRVK